MAVVDFFWWCEWMDVGGVWGEGKKGGVLGWLLVLLLLLRVGIVRIIILMYSLYYQSA